MTAPLKTTDLSFLRDREVLQVAVGRFQTIVQFDGEIALTIEGDCEVSGRICRAGVEAGARLLDTIGHKTTVVTAIDDRDIELTFDNETLLKLFATDEESESLTVTAPGITIVI